MPRPFVPREKREVVPGDGRLAECEEIITRGLSNFIEVGAALAEIRDAKLYREGYGTFQAYLKERWSLGRHRAYQLIDAAEAAGDVDEDTRMRLANPLAGEALAKVPEEHRAAVAAAAAEESEDGSPIRASSIRKAAAKIASMTDSVGNEIPANLRDAFAAIDDIKAIVADLRRAERSVVEHTTAGPGWEAVFVRAVRNDLANARRHLEGGRAHAVCPLCHGKGCRQCSDRGWMTQQVYEAQPAEHRWPE